MDTPTPPQSPPSPNTTTPTAIPTASLVPTPTPTVASAQLSITKTAFLFDDADSNHLVSPGDQLLYVITLSNIGNGPARQLHLIDTLDPNTTLVVGTVKTDQGQVSQGNSAGQPRVVVDIDAFAPGARATVSFQVRIQRQVNDTQVQNQAVATFVNPDDGLNGQTVGLSDDPDTPAALDATITPLNGHPPRPQPKVFLPFIAGKP